jgi:hypothetical protein
MFIKKRMISKNPGKNNRTRPDQQQVRNADSLAVQKIRLRKEEEFKSRE